MSCRNCGCNVCRCRPRCPSGPSGPSGPQGFSGLSGPSGPQGFSGPSGPSSLTGFSGNTLVFRPGGVAGGNVFTSWPLLVTAAQTIQGPKTIFMDPAFAPLTIPPGVWDFQSQTTFAADLSAVFSPGNLPTPITIQDGASFKNVDVWANLHILNKSNSPVDDNTSVNRQAVYLTGTTTLDQQAAGPFLHQSAIGANITLILRDFATVNTGTSPAFVSTAPGTIKSVLAFDGGDFSANNMMGPVGSSNSGIIASDSAFVSTAQAGVPSGSMAVAFWAESEFIQYIAAVPANWSGVNPSSVQNALDRIAAKIGPIA